MNHTNISGDKKRLLELLKNNAFFKEKIILSSGKASDYYIDARLVTLSPEGAELCARIIFDSIAGEQIDAVGGPTLGADPIVGALASLSFRQQRPVNTFIVRKASKAHGKQRQIEGPPVGKNARVIIIDDVATTGGSFVQSVEILRALGAEVVRAICIVDRQEGAREALAVVGCPLTAIFTASDFMT